MFSPSVVSSRVALTVLGLLAVGCGEDRDPIVSPPPTNTPVTITSVVPNTARTTSTTTITVNGSGFVSGSTVSLDDVRLTTTFVGSGSLRATAPPRGPGAVDVVVTNPNGETARLPRAFTYVLAPSALRITGNLALEAVGQTSQLGAIATFPDGTESDVTREARWSSSISTIATVSSTGLVTTHALGETRITAQYPTSGFSAFRSETLSVAPPGTYSMSGRVREPGAGGIAGARIQHVDSGLSVQTGGDGFYSVGALTGRRLLTVTRQDFEDVEVEVAPGTFGDIPLQRVVRLSAGSPVYTSTLAPNDVVYTIGETRCDPCRMLRLTSSIAGTSRVRLIWTGAANLQMLMDGRQVGIAAGTGEMTADIVVGQSDTLLYVGRVSGTAGNYIQFSVTAAEVQR